MRIVQLDVYQDLMGLSKKLSIMLEVLAGGLYRLDNVLGRECFLVAACHSNQQTLDQGKIGGQQREFLRRLGVAFRSNSFSPKGNSLRKTILIR